MPDKEPWLVVYELYRGDIHEKAAVFSIVQNLYGKNGPTGPELASLLQTVHNWSESGEQWAGLRDRLRDAWGDIVLARGKH